MDAIETTNNGRATKNKGKDDPIQKPTRQRSLPALQQVTGTSGMSEAAFVARVDKSPTDWQLLPLYALLSSAEDGSYPLVKISRSKCVSLVDGKSFSVGSGRCYRIVLSNR